MNQKVKADMTSGTPWRGMLRFALPLMAANFLQQLYNTVDTLIVGNFDSETALSAVGSCAYLTMLYLAVATGLSLGAGVIASRMFGARDEESLRRHAGTAVLFFSVLGAAIAAVSFLASGPILKSIIAVPDSVFDQAAAYMRIYSFGLIFQFGYNAVAALLRAVGDSRASLYFLAAASGTNIVLDLLFVAWFHWGAPGAAAATTLAQMISVVLCFAYMFRKYPIFRPDRENWKIRSRLVFGILRTGIPLSVQTAITSCGFMLLQRLVNSYGESMTAAYTVACRLEVYMLVPVSSVTSAVATYTGQNLGAGENGRIVKGVGQARILMLSIAAAVGIFCFFLAPELVGMFGLSGQSAAYSLSHVRLVSFDILLYALYQPLTGMYQGLGKGIFSALFSFIEIAGRVVFAYLLSGIIGPACAWWGEPFAWVSVIAAAYALYFAVHRRKLVTGETAAVN